MASLLRLRCIRPPGRRSVWRMVFAGFFMLVAGRPGLVEAEPQIPAGELENSACLACHQARDRELVAAWRGSAHAGGDEVANCVACHGSRHQGVAQRARRDSICIDCHGGVEAPVVHSYATSKHGILVRLARHSPDRPPVLANVRAPGCAYCHMHRGEHDVGRMVRSTVSAAETPAAELERVQDAAREVCQECHAPRYVSRLFANGERMLEVGRMKVREAAAAIASAGDEFSADELAAARERLETMQSRHLKNLYLGIGHQSPDYQWWHGQPALDGDLLRIKGALGRLRRLNTIDAGRQGAAAP